MRLVLQRVRFASVKVDDRVVGEIGPGMLVLAGVEQGDGARQVAQAAEKLRYLRIFEDAAGRMNLDAVQAGGSVLLVSQFTLAASTHKGRRPSFDSAAPAEEASQLLTELAKRLRGEGLEVETGSFGARMAVELLNDGPVTFVVDV